MNILGICGSPRTGGNTDVLLEKTLEGARAKGAKTEKIVLDKLHISPCKEEEYNVVNSDGFSIVDDDMKLIYSKVRSCDSIIVASPVFFGSVSAQLKTMIDRFQCVWISENKMNIKVFDKRIKGAFLCVAAADRADFFENAKFIVKHFFATIKAEYVGDVFCRGVNEKGDILKHPEMLDKAYELGAKLAQN